MKIFQVSESQCNGVQEAVQALQKGEVVAFPTDTLYGLGVDPFNEQAVEKVYAIKERSRDQALILMGRSVEDLIGYAAIWPIRAQRLAEAFWPGGVTLILPRHPKVPDWVVSNRPTVGLRVPSHPVALSLLEAWGDVLATTSANKSGEPPGSTGRQVAEQLGDTALSMLLDGGRTAHEEPSTLVDLSSEQPVVLREGAVSAEAIFAVMRGDEAPLSE